MHGKVHEWKMTEKERQEYIKKYPIKQSTKSKRKGKAAYKDVLSGRDSRKEK